MVGAVSALSTVSSASQPPGHTTAPLHEQMAWFLTTVNGTTTMVDKADAAALAGTLVGALQTAGVLLVTVLALSSAGEVAIHSADIAPAAGMLVAIAMWPVIGAGLGAIVRNQVGAGAAVLVWTLLLENLGAGLLERVDRFLPGQIVHARARTSEAIDLLAIGPAILLTAAFVGAGLAITRRRDVT